MVYTSVKLNRVILCVCVFVHVSEKKVEKMPTVDWIDVIEAHACYPNLHARYPNLHALYVIKYSVE